MPTAPSNATTYTVLVPLSDNEASAKAQGHFVASLPNASTTVSATLTHVLHGEELNVSRRLRSAQRVGTVVHVREFLQSKDIAVQVMDVDEPTPPERGILALGDKLDADLIVLGGGMHGILEDLLTGNVARAVGQRTNIPVTVVPEGYAQIGSAE